MYILGTGVLRCIIFADKILLFQIGVLFLCKTFCNMKHIFILLMALSMMPSISRGDSLASQMEVYLHYDNYDFLSCHIEKYGEGNKDWPWWYRSNDCGYTLEKCMKGFNPICRYSNRALALLDSYMKEGHSAHSEVMVTTCLHNHGISGFPLCVNLDGVFDD